MVMSQRGKLVKCGVWMALACAMTFSGCNFSADGDGNGHYTMRDPFPTDVSTIVVDMFFRGRDVYRRELEYRLTEAVQKRIEMTTNYKLTTRARADSELRGEVALVSQETLSFNPDTGNPRELEITMTIAFEWRDLRLGEVLVRRDRLQVTGTYIPDSPLSETFFDGSQDVIEKAAIRIVEHMETPWGDPPAEDVQEASAS